MVVSVKRIRSLACTTGWHEEMGSLSGLDSEPGEVECLGVS
jgi:hypothetical protein